MEWKSAGSDIFLRIDPGERLVGSLCKIAQHTRFRAAAITSGVGMIDGIEMGFFDPRLDDYGRTQLSGIYDLSSIQGNIVLRDGSYVPHVHAVFNDDAFTTFSGHLIEATCHITMEVFLSTTELALTRVKLVGCPATRIVGEI
jgi:predicted DNA-binding protein with PD1-like motif